MTTTAFKTALREVANSNLTTEQIATQFAWDASRVAGERKVKLEQYTVTMESILALALAHENCTDQRYLLDAVRDIRDMALARICGVM